MKMAVLNINCLHVLHIVLLLHFIQCVKGDENLFKYRRTPFFRETSQVVTVNVGESAILRCTIENLGPRLVNWRKLSVEYPLTVGEMIFMEKQDIDINIQRLTDHITRWDLVIKRVQKSDAGHYECQVSSTIPIKYVIQLKVLDYHNTTKPDIYIDGTTYVNLYQRINLTCNATGVNRAPEDIDWFHKGHKISQKNEHWRNRFQILKFKPEVMGKSLISRLIIDHGLSKDQGVYVCRSSDLLTTSIIVHVLNAERNVENREIKLTGRDSISDEYREMTVRNTAVPINVKLSSLTWSVIVFVLYPR